MNSNNRLEKGGSISNKAEYFILHLDCELLSRRHIKFVLIAISTPKLAHTVMFDEYNHITVDKQTDR